MGRPIVFFVAFCSVGALFLAAPAHGDEAKTLYNQGVIEFKEGDYAAAQAAFKESYNLSRRADLLFNLAVCAEHLGDVQRAIAYYQVYLDERPDAPDAEQVRVWIKKLRENLEKPALAVEVGPVEGQSSFGEVESSSEQPRERSKAPAELKEQAPKPADSEAGQIKAQPTAELPQNLVAEVGSEEEDHRTLYVPGALLGAGGLLLAGGLVAGIAARGKRDSLEQSCAPECSQGQIDKGKRIAVTADVLLGLGAASAVVGGVWLFVDLKKKKRTGEVRLTTAPLGDGAAVIVQGSFP